MHAHMVGDVNSKVCWSQSVFWNPTMDDRLIDQASDVPRIIFFHDFLQNFLQKYFQSICLFFLKNTKIKVKSFECPKSIKSLKKIILGRSDAWSTIRLSNPHWSALLILKQNFKMMENSNFLIIINLYGAKVMLLHVFYL